MNSESIYILGGKNISLATFDDNVFKWYEPCYELKATLEFSKAYVINHTDFNSGIQDCVYQVNGRTFTDLSCLKGSLIKKYPSSRSDYSYQLRKYSDGVKFLFYSEDVPTFDSDDREWDSMAYCAVYFDGQGVNLIHCHEGYKLPRIFIYVGLKKASAEFFRWLVYIGCPYSKFPQKI